MTELTLAATVGNITAATAFIDEQLETLNCNMKAQMQIDVAIDELFGNIAHYAYAGVCGDATVWFDFDEDTRTAGVTFIDSGVPFNPLERDDPDVTLSAEERGIGGLGIFMVKKSMDGMEYNYENGSNILTIYKQIWGAGTAWHIWWCAAKSFPHFRASTSGVRLFALKSYIDECKRNITGRIRWKKKKNEKGRVLGECVLRFIDEPEIIIKDNGELFKPDIEDERLTYNVLMSCNSNKISI